MLERLHILLLVIVLPEFLFKYSRTFFALVSTYAKGSENIFFGQKVVLTTSLFCRAGRTFYATILQHVLGLGGQGAAVLPGLVVIYGVLSPVSPEVPVL